MAQGLLRPCLRVSERHSARTMESLLLCIMYSMTLINTMSACRYVQNRKIPHIESMLKTQNKGTFFSAGHEIILGQVPALIKILGVSNLFMIVHYAQSLVQLVHCCGRHRQPVMCPGWHTPWARLAWFQRRGCLDNARCVLRNPLTTNKFARTDTTHQDKAKFVRLRRNKKDVAYSYYTKGGGPCTRRCIFCICPLDSAARLPMTGGLWESLSVYQKYLWFVDELEAQWQATLNTFPSTKTIVLVSNVYLLCVWGWCMLLETCSWCRLMTSECPCTNSNVFVLRRYELHWSWMGQKAHDWNISWNIHVRSNLHPNSIHLYHTTLVLKRRASTNVPRTKLMRDFIPFFFPGCVCVAGSPALVSMSQSLKTKRWSLWIIMWKSRRMKRGWRSKLRNMKT